MLRKLGLFEIISLIIVFFTIVQAHESSLCEIQDFPSWAACQKVAVKYRAENPSSVVETYNFGAHFKNMSNNAVENMLLEAVHILEENKCTRAYKRPWSTDPTFESGIHLSFAYFCNATMEEVKGINRVIKHHQYTLRIPTSANKISCYHNPQKPYYSLMLTFEPRSEGRLATSSRIFEDGIRRHIPTYNITWPRTAMGPFHITLGSINRTGCDIDSVLPKINRLVSRMPPTFLLSNLEANNQAKQALSL